MFLRCIVCLIITLSSISYAHAQNQSRAVAETNYHIRTDRLETDTTDTNLVHMSMVMAAGQASGFSIDYDYNKSDSQRPGIAELNAKTNGYTFGYFLRTPSKGRIGYKQGKFDQKLTSTSFDSNSNPVITSSTTDVDLETLYGELYLANSTISYTKTDNKYKNIGKSEIKGTALLWYPSPNFRVSYLNDEATSNIGIEKLETESFHFTYQPNFTKNIASLTLGYKRDKDDDDNDEVSLSLNFYFKSPVSLKERDRRFK